MQKLLKLGYAAPRSSLQKYTIVIVNCYEISVSQMSNASSISWRPVLVVEEAGVPGKLYHLRLRIECALFCNLQSPARTHAALVIGLYEFLGIPTT
jgi:hypothetical protein